LAVKGRLPDTRESGWEVMYTALAEKSERRLICFMLSIIGNLCSIVSLIFAIWVYIKGNKKEK
jgi:hypothetical protein